MHYPTLKTIPATREAVSAFAGLNRQGDIAPGEFAAMENLSSRHYPQAATSRANAAYLPDAQPRGILAKQELCYVEGTELVVGQERYDLSLTDGEKQLISMGAYILILPGERKLKLLDGATAVIPGVLPYTVAIGNYIRLGRFMPDMDFVFECGNRLWGCRYGLQQGKFVNEIYASALGDFRNWRSFQGVSTDAYTASVGTDGPFTGAMNYLGYPVFFKENFVHRVYGSYPAEYRIQTTPCAGVAAGCGKSLRLLGDTALYLGKDGVCAYDGAMPSLISRELTGLEGPATAAILGQEYFLSTPEALYVYDSRRRLWHRRSHIDATDMCAWDGRVFYFRLESPGLMELEAGSDKVSYFMETGIIAGSRQRRIRSICLRYSLTGWGRVMVEYDSSGVWLAVGDLPQTKLGWENLPMKPRRCDHFRLKLSGGGCLKIHSIIKTLEEGSDLP